jgi:hypothetical protein
VLEQLFQGLVSEAGVARFTIAGFRWRHDYCRSRIEALIGIDPDFLRADKTTPD